MSAVTSPEPPSISAALVRQLRLSRHAIDSPLVLPGKLFKAPSELLKQVLQGLIQIPGDHTIN